MSPGPATRRRSRALLSLLVSAGLLAWLWTRIDAAETWALLRSASLGPLLLAAGLGPLQIALGAERWRRAASQLGLPLERREAVLEYALSTLLNQVLPGGIAGDAVRVWRQRAPERAVGPVLRAAVAERVLGLAVHLAVVSAGLAAWGWAHPSVARPAGVVAVVAVLWLVLGSSALSRDVRVAVLAPRVVAGQVGLSAAMTALFLTAFALCAQALGQPLGWAVLTVVPLVLLAMVVPVTVGGWGLREATAMALLPALGWSEEAAVALSTAYGLTALLGALPGALVPLVQPRPS